MTTIIIIALALVGAGIYIYFHLKKAPVISNLSPLPDSEAEFPCIFAPWSADGDGTNSNESISKHGIWIHVPEAYGIQWLRADGTSTPSMTAPSLTGEFNPATIQAGLDKRNALKALNPNIKLFVQIGYAEGGDTTTDFPPDHPWWMRVNGERVKGWGWFGLQEGGYFFNLDLPQVRQHVADCCLAAKNTGAWDGVMLDVFTDDANRVDILRRIRAKVGDFLVIVAGKSKRKGSNPFLCPNIAPLVNGIYTECGPIAGAAQWKLVQDALDYNDRHVIQPSMCCLEISGYRVDIETMRAATCLSLTRSNGYCLFSDPGQGFASTHNHLWQDFWS